jgi:hypothetical protein
MSAENLRRSKRVKVFDEAVLGLTAIEAMEESCRCLRCDFRNGDISGPRRAAGSTAAAQ